MPFKSSDCFKYISLNNLQRNIRLLHDINNIQVIQQIKYKLFDKNSTGHLHLLIYLGYDELSFAIESESEPGIVFLKSFRLKEVNNYFAYKMLLSELFEQEEMFGKQYKDIKIAVNSAGFTLVPHKYYDPGSAEKFHDFNLQNDGGSKIMSNFVEIVNCFVVFSMDYQLMENLTDVFGNFTLQHSISYLIPAFASKNSGKTLFANFQKSNIDILSFDADKLLYCNSFKFQSSSDCLFHILNSAKHSGVDVMNDNFVFSGDISSEQQHYQLCQEYLSRLHFATRPESKTYCPELNVISPHQHVNLFAVK
ncbi:MAG: DUF3822 family protein [Sphingobacteriales bacterium]|nr:MAG: DUF3822 family protein [Sphingobacteriales bacterium]